MSGWLIQSKTGQGASVDGNANVSGLEPWFFDLVGKTHIPTRIYESADWQLVWFEYVGEQPEVARPDYAWDRLGPLPPDILVDGTPLSETAHPEVWTMFGEGWGLFDPAIGARELTRQADLWVYSPDARQVQLRLTPRDVGNASKLKVMVEGSPDTKPVPLHAEQTADTAITLQPGWNRVTLNVQRQRAKRDSTASVGEDAEPAPETRTRLILERLEIVTQPVT
jgi:hypothetical protein